VASAAALDATDTVIGHHYSATFGVKSSF
jgi:hypothetical protein